MYSDELVHFLDSVGRRARTSNALEESLPALRMALAARQASREWPEAEGEAVS